MSYADDAQATDPGVSPSDEDEATEVSERTGMPKINRQDLSVIKLPVPPFKEQLEIAKIIESIDDAMSLKTKKLSQTQFLKKSFMQDLLTGKVRVSVN